MVNETGNEGNKEEKKMEVLDMKESKDNGDRVPFLPSISNAVGTETEVKLVVKKEVGSQIEVQLNATLRSD